MGGVRWTPHRYKPTSRYARADINPKHPAVQEIRMLPKA